MFKLQVGRENKKGNWEWRDISPHHEEPYIFDTYDEAYNFLDWLYPEQIYDKDVRIIEIEQDA